jgi:F-box and leucine-rich repeat protein GRR1
VPITRACPLLIEMDLSHDPQITDASLYSVFLHLSHLRELRLVGNGDITARGIPNLAELAEDIEDDHTSKTNAHNFPWYTLLNGHRIMPRSTTFEHLRIVDLMSCAKLDDEAVDNLIWNAPKIRHLVLAKCPLLTDRSLESIARSGRHLHHLHLGHAAL